MIDESRGGLLSSLDRRAVARMLGRTVPDSARDLHYLRWQPSGDLAYHEAIIRWDCSHEQYLDFVREGGLSLFAESGPNVHLPIGWQAPDQIQTPHWWDPSGDTPADAASAQLGSYGSVAAKWESGHVYVAITDTGHRERAGKT